MGHHSTKQSPERLILTRLFAAQRRLRFVRSLKAALRWFALGSVLASLALIILWNWDYLPGPWQWLAAAGRPRELLWLPLLLALGGFASLWLVLPNPRQAAYRLDQILDSQERLLTSVDWILSEKPRTQSSERLLSQSAALLKDEVAFQSTLKKVESVPRKDYGLVLSLLLPLLLVLFLPAHLGLHPVTAVWLGEGQVDQLTEDLLKELENTVLSEDERENLEKQLRELLEKQEASGELGEAEKAAQKSMQRAIDQLSRQAEAQDKARELLETLAQRARQSQQLSQKDRDALDALRESLQEQSQSQGLDQAEQAWDREDFEKAAEALESLQQEAGQSAKDMGELAREAMSAEGMGESSGQEFDESAGDQFDESGFAKGQEGQGQSAEGQGEGQGGEGEGEGEGTGTEESTGSQPGRGTTLEESFAPPAEGAQSLRRSDSQSDWLEEYRHLHAPERTEFQKAQTRVQGQMGKDGPIYRSPKEGRGGVTQPSSRQGSGGVLEYRAEAENAILREEVPADYRDNVRVYFESLDQGQ